MDRFPSAHWSDGPLFYFFGRFDFVDEKSLWPAMQESAKQTNEEQATSIRQF